ncbi:hypothetical protein B0T10DRAFT_490379 [Thelonectria olida]|uniref:AMP-dependent synthetase/ligase domain-containing protein n=1 Tax=Thelonectria olida TaxID=1576542 RepID=A0A9P8W1Q9_9HYPO|nr:hypothetical protein B0T10DRAFT_490379 [Thelonectria olida]
MTTFKTQFSILQANATKAPSLAALKIPHYGSKGPYWKDISYSTLFSDVEMAASFWADRLHREGVQSGSVIGVWVKGTSYGDLVHVWGLSRSGFIPQLFSLRMTDPSVVYELLKKAGAVALLHDASYESFLHDSPVLTIPAGNIPRITDSSSQPLLPPICESSNAEDVSMIFHTSGSTSGVPNLVPITVQWLDALFSKIPHFSRFIPVPEKQEVMTAVGSFMHMGSNLCIWKTIVLGGCLVLPTDIPYSATELSRIIVECGLTKLVMFPPLLSIVFRQADKDPLLLERLQKLHAVIYAGMALNATDERWAHDKGICPVNLYGSTETGFAMCSGSTVETSSYLKPFPGSIYEFIPLQDGVDSDVKLLELTIPPESPECPVDSLRSSDGKFHTGDLFIEAEPGRYVSKGRADNWIKMQMGLRCDTGSIEANALQTCAGDLIHTVVVVGAGRPSPVMVVEPRDEISCADDGRLSHTQVDQLSKEVLQRITPFHQRRYKHERIDDAQFILVVQKGSLPRTTTKGNIRRKEVEHMLKDQLDQVFCMNPTRG